MDGFVILGFSNMSALLNAGQRSLFDVVQNKRAFKTRCGIYVEKYSELKR